MAAETVKIPFFTVCFLAQSIQSLGLDGEQQCVQRFPTFTLRRNGVVRYCRRSCVQVASMSELLLARVTS